MDLVSLLSRTDIVRCFDVSILHISYSLPRNVRVRTFPFIIFEIKMSEFFDLVFILYVSAFMSTNYASDIVLLCSTVGATRMYRTLSDFTSNHKWVKRWDYFVLIKAVISSVLTEAFWFKPDRVAYALTTAQITHKSEIYNAAHYNWRAVRYRRGMRGGITKKSGKGLANSHFW
jgi:hypothetical protein